MLLPFPPSYSSYKRSRTPKAPKKKKNKDLLDSDAEFSAWMMWKEN
tara:strand:+ start:1306 stop:1443 length:138 start_codon:yes stop_codon:yes gene_type:complete